MRSVNGAIGIASVACYFEKGEMLIVLVFCVPLLLRTEQHILCRYFVFSIDNGAVNIVIIYLASYFENGAIRVLFVFCVPQIENGAVHIVLVFCAVLRMEQHSYHRFVLFVFLHWERRN